MKLQIMDLAVASSKIFLIPYFFGVWYVCHSLKSLRYTYTYGSCEMWSNAHLWITMTSENEVSPWSCLCVSLLAHQAASFINFFFSSSLLLFWNFQLDVISNLQNILQKLTGILIYSWTRSIVICIFSPFALWVYLSIDIYTCVHIILNKSFKNKVELLCMACNCKCSVCLIWERGHFLTSWAVIKITKQYWNNIIILFAIHIQIAIIYLNNDFYWD